MKILLDNELAIQQLPESKATFYFTDGKNVIFAGLTSNLFTRINKLSEQRNSNDKLKEMWSKAVDLIFDLRLSDIDSLVWYKSLVRSFTPYYNDYINLWESYSYLAIDLSTPPYLSIKDNTQSDKFYIGPFRSRFFISDVFSIFNKYLKLPICPDNPDACELKDSEACISTCTKDNLPVLKNLIHKYYLSANNDFADRLLQKYQDFHNDLEFLKAEEVKIETKIILKYYKFLNFLNKTKDLNSSFEYDNRVYFIEDGLLAEVSGQDSIDFRSLNRRIPYRENEMLAVNKNQLDERWIVFNFLEEVKSK